MLDLNQIINDLYSNELSEEELYSLFECGYLNNYEMDFIYNCIQEANCRVEGATLANFKDAINKEKTIIGKLKGISNVFVDGLKTTSTDANKKYKACLNKEKINENTFNSLDRAVKLPFKRGDNSRAVELPFKRGDQSRAVKLPFKRGDNSNPTDAVLRVEKINRVNDPNNPTARSQSLTASLITRKIRENTAAGVGSFAPITTPVVRHVNPYAGQSAPRAYYNGVAKPMLQGTGRSLLNAGKTAIGYDPKAPSILQTARKYLVNKIASKFVTDPSPYAHTANMIMGSR